MAGIFQVAAILLIVRKVVYSKEEIKKVESEQVRRRVGGIRVGILILILWIISFALQLIATFLP